MPCEKDCGPMGPESRKLPIPIMKSSQVAKRNSTPLLAILGLTILSFLGLSSMTEKTVHAGGGKGPNPSATAYDKLSSDIRNRKETSSNPEEVVSVILKLNAKPSGQLNGLLNRNGVHIRKHFD